MIVDSSSEKQSDFDNEVIDVAKKEQPLDTNSNVLTDISLQNTSEKPCGCDNLSCNMPMACAIEYISCNRRSIAANLH
jgi:hypothetical protein